MNLTKKKSQLLRKVDKTLSTKPSKTFGKSDITIDTIFENERGSILFSSAQFSKKALLPTDPPAFSDAKGGYVLDIKYFQCPPEWEWVSEWMPDMNGNVDDQGWTYNSSFTSNDWKNSAQQVGNVTLVRRRRWTRMRRVQGYTTPELQKQTSGMDQVIGLVQRKRSDREKLLVLEKHVESMTDPAIRQESVLDPVLYTTILQELDCATSLLEGCLLVAPFAKEHPDLIRKCICLLQFGSDKITFLKATNLDKFQYKSILEY